MFRKKASRQQQDGGAGERPGASSLAGRLGRHPIWLRSLLGACGIVLVGGLLLRLASGHRELDPRTLAEFSNPATVMIETAYSGTVTVPDFNLSSHGSLVTQQLNDAEVPQDAMLDLLHAVADHPLEMLTPAGGESHALAGGAQGTGFIVTPNGYVVTNAQVVNIEQALKEQPALQTATNTLNTLNKNFQHNYHAAIPNDLQAALTRAFYTFYLQCITLHLDAQHTYAAMGAMTPGTAVVQHGFPCTIVNIGAPLPGKDVAILKMDGANLPTLPCGDDAAMTTGAQIMTIGYPAMTAFHTLSAVQDNAIEPTLESGVIYARQAMPGEWTAMQTDAAITHGDSGGPALNSDGAVIGIATAGQLDPLTNQPVNGLNYIVPMSVVAEFLHQAATPGPPPANFGPATCKRSCCITGNIIRPPCIRSSNSMPSPRETRMCRII